MLLFKPKCNVLLNLVGLHDCIHWIGVPVFTPWPFQSSELFIFYAILICLFLDMRTSGNVKRIRVFSFVMRKTKRFIFIQNTNNALIQTKKQISKRE